MEPTEYIHAVILGIVQGIAEFLPISSSGHLVIADALLREYSDTSTPKEGVTMSIALHFGTLLSILIVYREDLFKLVTDKRLMLMIVVATIPVGLVGILLKDYVDEAFGSPMMAGAALLVTAAFLLIGRQLQSSVVGQAPACRDTASVGQAPACRNAGKSLDQLSIGTATLIGIFQAIAIIPGISRSGSTIAAGMATGLNREHAARFSFLIAIPAIGGASVVQMKDLLTGEEALPASPWPILLGTIVAFVVGLAALRLLIRLVVADRLHYFAFYCIAVGCLTMAWQMLK